jgi:hypothetical protein
LRQNASTLLLVSYCEVAYDKSYYSVHHSNLLKTPFVYFQGDLNTLGEVLLQDNFTVWDPKQLIKKGRERHLFLFELCLLLSKEVKDSTGKSKYSFKLKLPVRKAAGSSSGFYSAVRCWIVGENRELLDS